MFTLTCLKNEQPLWLKAHYNKTRQHMHTFPSPVHPPIQPAAVFVLCCFLHAVLTALNILWVSYQNILFSVMTAKLSFITIVHKVAAWFYQTSILCNSYYYKREYNTKLWKFTHVVSETECEVPLLFCMCLDGVQILATLKWEHLALHAVFNYLPKILLPIPSSLHSAHPCFSKIRHIQFLSFN
jgi:hypothetical protein